MDKGDPNIVDDRDGINEEEEYEQWRLRELKRIRRQQEEIEQCVPRRPAHASAYARFSRWSSPGWLLLRGAGRGRRRRRSSGGAT